MFARLKKRMGRKSQSAEDLDQDFFKLIPFETSAQIFSFLTLHEAASVATTSSLFLSLY